MPDDAINMTRKPAMKVGYASEKKPVMVAGRRDFFAYRDLGIGEASGGAMRGQVMKAITGMTQPTGWHYHTCDGQFVYALKGWVELEFESEELRQKYIEMQKAKNPNYGTILNMGSVWSDQ